MATKHLILLLSMNNNSNNNNNNQNIININYIKRGKDLGQAIWTLYCQSEANAVASGEKKY